MVTHACGEVDRYPRRAGAAWRLVGEGRNDGGDWAGNTCPVLGAILQMVPSLSHLDRVSDSVRSMMFSRDQYPKLCNFIACAFHQDFDEVADTLPGVVDANLIDAPAVYVQELAAEAAALLASSVTNEELAKWLETHVLFEVDGYTPRTFITMISDRLQSHSPIR